MYVTMLDQCRSLNPIEVNMAQAARVLVVDDDKGIREFISMALTDEGYEVITANDGVLALDIIAKQRLNLILLDMRMPNMDGHAFLHSYRQKSGDRPPVIVLSAAHEKAD